MNRDERIKQIREIRDRNSRDWFFEKWEGVEMDNFDRNFNRGFGAIVALWVVGSIVSLALTATIIWAIIQLVQHFTA